MTIFILLKTPCSSQRKKAVYHFVTQDGSRQVEVKNK